MHAMNTRGGRVYLYVRLTDSCITQLKAQEPARTCNESKEEAEERTCHCAANSPSMRTSVAKIAISARYLPAGEREFVIDNLLVRIHFIIVMIRWTGLASWEFEFPFPCSIRRENRHQRPVLACRGEVGILLPNNQRQHRTLHIHKGVLPFQRPVLACRGQRG